MKKSKAISKIERILEKAQLSHYKTINEWGQFVIVIGQKEAEEELIEDGLENMHYLIDPQRTIRTDQQNCKPFISPRFTYDYLTGERLITHSELASDLIPLPEDIYHDQVRAEKDQMFVPPDHWIEGIKEVSSVGWASGRGLEDVPTFRSNRVAYQPTKLDDRLKGASAQIIFDELPYFVTEGFSKLNDREPYSEPFTLRERLDIWYICKRKNLFSFFADTLPLAVARKLPRRLQLWVLVNIAASTLGNTPVTELTYDAMAQRWEQRDCEASI